MAINASIPLGVQPVQIENPLNKLAQVLQIKDAQTAGQMRSMQMSELQREATERNALNEAWRGAVGPDGMPDRNKLFQSLATGGMGAKIPGLQKQFLEADTAGATLKKTQTETQKSELEQALKKAEHASSVLSLAKDPQTYATVRAVVKSQFGQVLPEQFDPAMVQAIIAQGQTLTQRLAAEHQRLTLAETGRHNVATERNAAGQLRVAQGNLNLRGQELDHNRNQPKGVVVQTESGPMLVDPRTGTGRAVTGADGQPIGKKDKPLSNAALKQLQEVRDNAVTLDTLLSGFKDDFAGKGIYGLGADTSLAAKAVLGSDRESVEWWKNYRKQAELVERHSMFGAALTPTEQASWRNADIGPGLDKEVIKKNLQTRANLTKKMLETTRQDLIDAGQSEQRVNAIAGRGPQAAPTPATPNSGLPPGWSVKAK
jgi:hypothetical protein